MELLGREERDAVMKELMVRMEHYLEWRTKGELPTAAIVFSSGTGKIGETACAEAFLKKIAENEETIEE